MGVGSSTANDSFCSACNDSEPDAIKRNTDKKTINQPLLTDNDNIYHDIKPRDEPLLVDKVYDQDKKEMDIEINKSIVIAHIAGLQTSKFVTIWNEMDPNGIDQIDLNNDNLKKLFLIFIDDYINSSKNIKSIELESKYNKQKQSIANELIDYMQSKLKKDNYNTLLITKDQYIANFQQYFSQSNNITNTNQQSSSVNTIIPKTKEKQENELLDLTKYHDIIIKLIKNNSILPTTMRENFAMFTRQAGNVQNTDILHGLTKLSTNTDICLVSITVSFDIKTRSKVKEEIWKQIVDKKIKLDKQKTDAFIDKELDKALNDIQQELKSIDKQINMY